MYIDEVSKGLYEIMPPLTKKEDFDTFCEETIRLAKSIPLQSTLTEYDYPSPYVKVYSITFNGFANTPIHGLYLVPTFIQKENYPCLIHYHGRGGNCGKPADFMQWVMLGIAVISIDIRDQSGETCDYAPYTRGFHGNTSLRGILNQEEYYFRSIYMDAMKAIDFACEQKEVDVSQIIIEGSSQGGAIVSAISALDQRPFLALADVPSNSWLEKRVEGKNGSFGAVYDFLAKNPQYIDQVFDVLSYFDTMNMADKITCKTLASVGLKDPTCPAEHYFATYNRINCEKEIKIYPFGGHEVSAIQNEIKLKFVAENIK